MLMELIFNLKKGRCLHVSSIFKKSVLKLLDRTVYQSPRAEPVPSTFHSHSDPVSHFLPNNAGQNAFYERSVPIPCGPRPSCTPDHHGSNNLLPGATNRHPVLTATCNAAIR